MSDCQFYRSTKLSFKNGIVITHGTDGWAKTQPTLTALGLQPSMVDPRLGTKLQPLKFRGFGDTDRPFSGFPHRKKSRPYHCVDAIAQHVINSAIELCIPVRIRQQ